MHKGLQVELLDLSEDERGMELKVELKDAECQYDFAEETFGLKGNNAPVSMDEYNSLKKELDGIKQDMQSRFKKGQEYFKQSLNQAIETNQLLREKSNQSSNPTQPD